MLKITTLEFPNNVQTHDLPDGALVGDLLGILGNTAVLKQANAVLSPEVPLTDGMRLALSRKDATTGVQSVKKIAGANDQQILWKAEVISDKTTLSFPEWLKTKGETSTVSNTPIEGAVTFSFEKLTREVEHAETITQFEGTTVMSVLQDLGYGVPTAVEVNGEKVILGYIIKNGDKVVVIS